MQAAWEYAADEYIRIAEQAAGCRWDAAQIYVRDADPDPTAAAPSDPTSTDTTAVVQAHAGAADAGHDADDDAETFSLELPPQVKKRMRVE